MRNALLAVAMARHGTPGGETTLEGEAGFYHSYAGNNQGHVALQLHRRQPRRASTRSPKASARDWISPRDAVPDLFDRPATTSPMSTSPARLCEEHNITYADIDRIEAVVNWLETEYPSPAFPSRGIDIPPRPGSTQYFTAYGAVDRRLPDAARRRTRARRHRPAGSASI